MQKSGDSKPLRKPQHQHKPGQQSKMDPQPVSDRAEIKGTGKLKGKIAVVTGGDSGIGRAVSILFAKEGANVAIIYVSEKNDAEETGKIAKQYGSDFLAIETDLSKEKNCIAAVSKIVKKFGRIDVLVNNAATHTEQEKLEDISTKQLMQTFSTNVFSMFWITKAALPYMKNGGAIINTTSVTAYRGSDKLIDYASTKSAIVGFTRSLSSNLIARGIRVNAVAPGPIWTPLVPSSFPAKKVAKFGSEVPMKRAGEPVEVATCFLFLASDDASYITGQVLHPNGGEIING